jgi:predicted esterase
MDPQWLDQKTHPPHAVVLCAIYGHAYPPSFNDRQANPSTVLRVLDLAMYAPERTLLNALSERDFAVISFSRGKCMFSGYGAIGFTRDLELAREVRRLRDATLARPGVEPPRPGVLIAFSQGAYVAMEVLAARPGRVSAALFIGAAIHPSRQSLAKVGVSRVALAAGRYDMTYDAMRKAARALETEGVDARFFDLGPVGHTYVPSDPRVLPQVLAWLTAATAEPS